MKAVDSRICCRYSHILEYICPRSGHTVLLLSTGCWMMRTMMRPDVMLNVTEQAAHLEAPNFNGCDIWRTHPPLASILPAFHFHSLSTTRGAGWTPINSVFRVQPAPSSQDSGGGISGATCSGDPSNCVDDSFGKAFCTAITTSTSSNGDAIGGYTCNTCSPPCLEPGGSCI